MTNRLSELAAATVSFSKLIDALTYMGIVEDAQELNSIMSLYIVGEKIEVTKFMTKDDKVVVSLGGTPMTYTREYTIDYVTEDEEDPTEPPEPPELHL